MLNLLTMKDVSVGVVATYLGEKNGCREYEFNKYIFGYQYKGYYVDIFTKEVYPFHEKHHDPKTKLIQNNKYVYYYLNIFADEPLRFVPASPVYLREKAKQLKFSFEPIVFDEKAKILTMKQ